MKTTILSRWLDWIFPQPPAPTPAPAHHRRHTDTPLFDDELDLHGIDEPHVALTAEEVRRERVRLARLAVASLGPLPPSQIHTYVQAIAS